MSYIIYIWICLIVSVSIHAQNSTVSFQHVTIEDGLSDKTVNTVVQDNRGFVWIGTNSGLNIYNGYTTQVLHPKDGDTNSMGFDGISISLKDSKGRLWFAGNGLMCCNPYQLTFTTFQHHDSIKNSLGTNDVSALVEDEFGTIWVGTRLGLYKFIEETKTFKAFIHDSSASKIEKYSKNRITALVSDKNGNLWMTTIAGVYKFSIQSGKFSSFTNINTSYKTELANHMVGLTFIDNSHLVIATLSAGLYVLDIKTGKFISIEASSQISEMLHSDISYIFKAGNGDLYIALRYQGLIRYQLESNKWTCYKHDIYNKKSIGEDKLTYIYQDQSGMIWVGTSNNGVDRFSLIPEKFETYISQPGKPQWFNEGEITCFQESKNGDLWMGTKNGLLKFDRKKQKFNVYTHNENQANSLIHDMVFNVATDIDDRLWVATAKGISLYNPKNSKWVSYVMNSNDSNSLPNDLVYNVLVAKDQSVWLATANGVAKYNPQSKSFISRNNNQKIASFPRVYYSLIYEDSKSNLWTSTSRSGFMYIDKNFNVIKSYIHSPLNQISNVHQFAEDNNENIWIAANNGLYLWKRATQTLVKISQFEELNTEIKSVVVESAKEIWVSTSYGIIKINLNNNYEPIRTKKFLQADGLQGNIFNNFAGKKLESGEIIFGGTNGFSIFKSDEIVYNSYIPKVQLSSFKIFDKEFKIEVVNDTLSQVHLDYKQNFLSFELMCSNFDHPEKNTFSYQLIGVDADVVELGNRHNFSYTNLEPGEYMLHIMASNNDDIWNKRGSYILITIDPPFWKTLWFRLSTLLFVLILIYIWYRQKINKIKKEAQIKSDFDKQLSEARLLALRAQMNPHFVFNSLNSIQLFIANADKENALRYMSKFAKLIRLVLQNASKNFNTIESELNMLTYYLQLEQLRFSNKFDFEFKIDPNINQSMVKIPSMLVQPYVENAIIHGLLNKNSQGYICISMDKNENEFICKIEDNGIGRKAAQLISKNKSDTHESLGIIVNEERTKIIESLTNKKTSINIIDLYHESGDAKGTQVVIKMYIEDEYD